MAKALGRGQKSKAEIGSAAMRPRCSLILGSANSRLRALSRASVPSSSTPIRREYPATSAARMAASLRSTRPVAKAVLPNRMGRLDHRLCETHSNGKREPRHSLSVKRSAPCDPAAFARIVPRFSGR